MPYTGTVTFTDNEGNHPNGHFFLIGDDDKPYIAGLSDRGGATRIVIGSVEDDAGDIFVIDEAKWQADFTTWRADNGVLEGGTFFMGQGAIPIPGTALLYVGGYQKAGFDDSPLSAGEGLCCWVRYRIVDADNLIIDGGAIYKTGPNPAYEALTDVNWGWCASTPINGSVYAVLLLSVGIAVGAAGSATGPGTFLIDLPTTGNPVELIDNSWKEHATRFGPTVDFLQSFNSGENDRLSAAVFKTHNPLHPLDPSAWAIGVLTYQTDGENPTALIDTPGSEYWIIDPNLQTVITDQQDKRTTLNQPWSDARKFFDGTPDTGGGYHNDYGAPVVTALSNGKNELIFGRTFTDNVTKARFRRFIQNPTTGSILYDGMFETTIGDVLDFPSGAVAFRFPSDEILAAISWRSWQKFSYGNIEIDVADVCINTSGFSDDDLAIVEASCDAEWPIDDLKPRDISIIPVQQSIGGGPMPSGNEQVEVAEDPAAFPDSSPAANPSTAGFWRVQYGSVPIRTLNQVRKWRETQALLNGRQGVCCVPFNDGKRAPWENGVVAAHAASSAAIGDTDIDIEVTVGSALESGMHFSAGEEGHERAYRIVEVSGPESPSLFACTIWPPFRAPITVLDDLEFEHPVCRMRLASDDGMSVQLSLMRFAEPSVDWVEDV